jgi:hypothetical protein
LGRCWCEKGGQFFATCRLEPPTAPSSALQANDRLYAVRQFSNGILLPGFQSRKPLGTRIAPCSPTKFCLATDSKSRIPLTETRHSSNNEDKAQEASSYPASAGHTSRLQASGSIYRPTNTSGGRPALDSDVWNLWEGTVGSAAASRPRGRTALSGKCAAREAVGKCRGGPPPTSLDRSGASSFGYSCNWSPAHLGRGELWLLLVTTVSLQTNLGGNWKGTSGPIRAVRPRSPDVSNLFRTSGSTSSSYKRQLGTPCIRSD